MIELSRTVRFCVSSDDAPASVGGVRNGFAGWPPMTGLGAFYELVVKCRGEPDPITGYLMNIREIDDAVRRHALPAISAAYRARGAAADPAALLAGLLKPLNDALHGTLASVQWKLTPYHALQMTTTLPDQVLLTQQFEFAASHRLHNPALSEAHNRELFGKCNNLNGHGHNYRLEVAVAVPLESKSAARRLELPQLEAIVDRAILKQFDHTHLNQDRPEFATTMPSVEHIARVCFELLAQPIKQAAGDLQRVTVWETDRTSSTYWAPTVTP